MQPPCPFWPFLAHVHRKPILYLSLRFLFCYIFFLNTLILFLSPLLLWEDWLFSLFWPDWFLSCFSKNKHQSESVLESFFTRKPCPTLHRFGKIKSILSKLLLVVVFIPATESKPGQAYTYPPCGYSINCRGSCLHRPSEAQAETFVSTHLDVYLSFCKHVYASYNSLKCYVNKLGKWQIKNYFSYENEVIISVNNDYVWDCWKMLLLILRC